MPRRNYKPGDSTDHVGSKIFECTAFTSDGRDVLVYTDEGGENPIRVPNNRLDALVLTALDAVRGRTFPHGLMRDAFARVAEALVPCAESHDQFMTRIRCNNGLADFLVESGTLSRADFERAWDRYQNGDDGEED